MRDAAGRFTKGTTGDRLRGEPAKLDNDTWVEDIRYRQTRTYVKRVLQSLFL